jgi:hypothetical protein
MYYIRQYKFATMKYFIIAILFISSAGFAQKTTTKTKKATAPAQQKSAAVWDELDKTFIAFIKALENKDKAAFTSLSLANVDCAECPGAEEGGNFVPAEVFYITVAADFTVSPVYKALAKRGYAFNSMILKDFKPSFLPNNYPKDLKVYEVWVHTYKPDELSKGHKGTSHAFQFIKVNGGFKFFGLTSQ